MYFTEVRYSGNFLEARLTSLIVRLGSSVEVRLHHMARRLLLRSTVGKTHGSEILAFERYVQRKSEIYNDIRLCSKARHYFDEFRREKWGVYAAHLREPEAGSLQDSRLFHTIIPSNHELKRRESSYDISITTILAL